MVNVSGTPTAIQSNVWISQQRIRITGNLLVEPTSTGLVVVSADISLIGNPGTIVPGNASAFDPGASVAPAACRVEATGSGTLIIAFEASTTGEHNVAYNVEYSV